MMYPPLAKADYSQLRAVFSNWRALGLSLVQNWVIGPTLTFGLAVIFSTGLVPGLPARPGPFLGLVFVGMARCIAMVLVWNELTEGSTEYVTGLVAFNSLFQIITYRVYVWLLGSFVCRCSGRKRSSRDRDVRRDPDTGVPGDRFSLRLPFLGEFLTRYVGTQLKSEEWYEETLIPRIDPVTLVALLFTVIVMFATQGENIVASPGNVLLIAVPLPIYFVVMSLVSFGMGRGIGADYSTTTAIGFTAVSNNLELAIAVAVFGVGSGVAFTTVVGPLIEVPVLLALVDVAPYFQRSFRWSEATTGELDSTTTSPAEDD
jgi:ACR3 family arsenite transporter